MTETLEKIIAEMRDWDLNHMTEPPLSEFADRLESIAKEQAEPAPTSETQRLRAAIIRIAEMIADDSYAMQFQTMGRYRRSLILGITAIFRDERAVKCRKCR